MARWCVLAGALALVAGACNQVHPLAYKAVKVPAPPPPTAPLPTLPDGSGVSLPVVAGVTTTTAVGASGGNAVVRGTVLGPSGGVAGATVVAQRVVPADGVAVARGSVTAVTGPDGGFALAGLVGGVYRVRSWEAPQLALTTPVTFFLGAGTQHSVTLHLASFTTPGVVGVVNPDPPVTGRPVNLAVQITMPAVGADGVVRHPALSGASVALANGPGWEILSDQPAVVTGSNGEASFELECVGAGTQPLDVQVNGAAPVSLGLPDCVPPPPAPTTAAPSTTAPAPRSTTTAPTATGSTSSTSSTSSPSSSSSSTTAGR